MHHLGTMDTCTKLCASTVYQVEEYLCLLVHLTTLQKKITQSLKLLGFMF